MVDVLIVDDQPLFRAVTRTVAGMVAGWQAVGEAVSGEDAVAKFDELRPGIVLMDINLPGINGIEATRRILSIEPATRVVLLSTYAADDLPADAQSCGAAGYIRKEDLTSAALRELLPA